MAKINEICSEISKEVYHDQSSRHFTLLEVSDWPTTNVNGGPVSHTQRSSGKKKTVNVVSPSRAHLIKDLKLVASTIKGEFPDDAELTVFENQLSLVATHFLQRAERADLLSGTSQWMDPGHSSTMAEMASAIRRGTGGQPAQLPCREEDSQHKEQERAQEETK